MNQLMTVSQASALIRSGAPLCLAGPEAALDRMPAGEWIGGTTAYAMLAGGSQALPDDAVFVTGMGGLGEVKLACLQADELARISGDTPERGFALAILPGGSPVHQRFAVEAASHPDVFAKPTVGWIAGVHASEVGHVPPKVYDGRTAARHTDRAVVAHVAVPRDKLVSVEVVNLFEPDGGDVLRFADAAFSVRSCEVNGHRTDFAGYVRGRGLQHGRLPLVGDFAGARISASLQAVHDDGVTLYAPVLPGVDYHFAKPVADYAAAFRTRLADVKPSDVVFGCNCILNYLFGELDGKALGGVQGPITFGEIACLLLNQTLVIVRVS